MPIVSKSLTVTFTCLLLALSSILVAQPGNYSKTPAIGLHLAYFDLVGADDLGRQMKPGIAIHFQNNLTKQFGYNGGRAKNRRVELRLTY